MPYPTNVIRYPLLPPQRSNNSFCDQCFNISHTIDQCYLLMTHEQHVLFTDMPTPEITPGFQWSNPAGSETPQ
ncbi:hypothetical protein FRX31_024572, partial [Thalictrum thalictroides]